MWGLSRVEDVQVDHSLGRWIVGARPVITYLRKTTLDAALAYQKSLRIESNP